MILADRTKEVFIYRNTRFRSMMDQKVFRADRARMELISPPLLSATNRMSNKAFHQMRTWSS